MYEIVEAVRRPDGPGTLSRVVPYNGRYCLSRMDADAGASVLRTAAFPAERGHTYTIRKVYLPACPDHPANDPNCGLCQRAVDLWLGELRGNTQPPPVTAAPGPKMAVPSAVFSGPS